MCLRVTCRLSRERAGIVLVEFVSGEEASFSQKKEKGIKHVEFISGVVVNLLPTDTMVGRVELNQSNDHNLHHQPIGES